MPRPKGLPKTGGRLKGTPNKKSAYMRDRLAELKFDIALEAKRLFTETNRDDIKLAILKMLADFTLSKPKAVEVDDQEDSGVVDVDFESLDPAARDTILKLAEQKNDA